MIELPPIADTVPPLPSAPPAWANWKVTVEDLTNQGTDVEYWADTRQVWRALRGGMAYLAVEDCIRAMSRLPTRVGKEIVVNASAYPYRITIERVGSLPNQDR